ncbi:glutamate receptor ionotropic, kainate 2 isoform X2 [Nematostella vectensis]|uniref:glutamate receptor ionotropic, kainate 2 isoform X2 n=1 Tax=Nematostella vectensis TaxID=45351 RepID=UPI0020772154|nr:glutamate receptor ionotropic, kainate 2 isoform X2 [Nematostella vectensis]
MTALCQFFVVAGILTQTWKGAQAILAKNIIVGVLYTKEYENMGFLFQPAMLRREVVLPGTYVFKPVMINVDGKELLTKEVATSLSTAVCIFDLYTGDSDAYALAEMLRIPLIQMEAFRDDPPNPFVISMRPHYHMVSRALFDMSLYFGFKDISIIYDRKFVVPATDFFNLARTSDRFQVYMMPSLDLQGNIQVPLTVLKNSWFKNIIIFCDQEDLARIMNMALFVGFNDDSDYKWIASDLEVAGPNKTYPSILGMVGLSLNLDNDRLSEHLQRTAITLSVGKILSPVAYSVVNDSIQVVANAIRSLISASLWPKIYPRPANQDCPLQDDTGKLGPTLLDAIKGRKDRGMTGPISFNKQGQRNAKGGFDILNIREDDVEKVGKWTPSPMQDTDALRMKSVNPVKWVGQYAEMVKCHNPNTPGSSLPRPKRVIKLTAVIEPPFLDWRNGSIETRPVSNESLQGFLIDVINELSTVVGFEYEIDLRRDTNYASMVNGRVTGMVGDLIDKKADMALAPITITAERESKIDFSKPFMDFMQSLIMKEMKEEEISLFAFVQPFDGTVWLLIILVVLFVTIMMFVVDLWSPFGHRAEARITDEGAGDEFNLFNSLWFATASMLQQGPDNTPKSPSGRILASAFWFFILIIISTYTANLAAFFTKKTSKNFIETLDDLTKQKKISYGCLKGGSMASFFEKSNNPLYKTMFRQMEFVSSTKEGVARVREGTYAYLTEQPYLDYYNKREPCDTILLNNLLTAKSYGFGMQRNSPYINEISVGILNLRESGFIERARVKWWDDRSECPEIQQESSTQSLGIKNMAGVFIILMGGVGLSLILIIIEIKCKRLVDMLTHNQSLEERMNRSKLSVNKSTESVNPPREQNNIPVRVVLSQGKKELKPGATYDPRSPITSPRGV